MLAFGSMLHRRLRAAEQLDATVANMRFVKPIDIDLIELARADARRAGDRRGKRGRRRRRQRGGRGARAARHRRAAAASGPARCLRRSRRSALLLAQCGLDAKGIAASILERFGPRKPERMGSKPAAAGAGRSGRSVSTCAKAAECLAMSAHCRLSARNHEASRNPNARARSPTSSRHPTMRRTRDRSRRHPRPALSDQFADADGARAVDDRDLRHLRGVARRAQGHAHVAAGRRDRRDARARCRSCGCRLCSTRCWCGSKPMRGHIDIEFPWFIRKAAPVSGVREHDGLRR